MPWDLQLGALCIYADTADITAPIRITDTTISDSTCQALMSREGNHRHQLRRRHH